MRVSPGDSRVIFSTERGFGLPRSVEKQIPISHWPIGPSSGVDGRKNDTPKDPDGLRSKLKVGFHSPSSYANPSSA